MNSDDHKYDDMIKQLSGELKPVCCLGNPYLRAMKWLSVGLISVVIIGAILGFRGDLGTKMMSPGFELEIIVALLLAVSSAIAASWLSVPDGAEKKQVVIMPYILVAFAGLLFARETFHHGIDLPEFKLTTCMLNGLIMGLIPVALMVYLMKCGASTRPVLMTLVSMIASGSIGYIGLRLICHSDAIGHVCLYHVVPFVVIGLILGLLARRLFRW